MNRPPAPPRRPPAAIRTLAMPWWRATRRGLGAAAAAVLLLAGCGGSGSSDPPAEKLDPSLATAPAWRGSSLPAGARVMSQSDFVAWAAGKDLTFLVDADQQAAEAAHAQAVANDQRLALAAMAQDPELAYTLTVSPPDASAVDRGGVRHVQLGSGQIVALNGEKTMRSAYAASVRAANDRATVQAQAEALIAMLPEDQQAEFAAPSNWPTMSDAELQDLRDRLARRAADLNGQTDLPDVSGFDAPPAAAARAGAKTALAARRLAFDGAGGTTGCQVDDDQTMSTSYSWSLKTYITPIRKQGRRGTCTAQAIVGGIETLFRRTGLREVNLAEQSLYAEAQASWFPDANAYGDGLGIVSTVGEMKSRGYRVPLESAWPYNPSSKREDDDAARRYTHSCDDYTGPCADTNHQYPVVCTTVAAVTYCVAQRPATVSDPNADHGRVTAAIPLWNPAQKAMSLALIKAFVGSGYPVMIGMALDRHVNSIAGTASNFRWAGRIQKHEPDSPIDGSHSMLVVGFLENGQLDPGDRALDADGYLVLKNSWGCEGDHGHVYLAYSVVLGRAFEAMALTGAAVKATMPTATLTPSKTFVRGPGDAVFTTKSNEPISRVELWSSTGAQVAELVPATPAKTLSQTLSYLGFAERMQEGPNHLLAKVVTETGRAFSNWVTVFKDTQLPTVTLSASATTITAPGSVQLTAAATDASGIAKVEFYRYNTRIATVTAPPFKTTVNFAPLEFGNTLFLAIATDNAGRMRMAPPVTVTSTGLAKPLIGSFTATPDVLPGAGAATLAWNVLGASSVSIDHGVGPQAALATGSVQVSVPSTTTTYTLTASNAAGSTTRQATVAVQLVLPPTIASFVATPDALPLGGGNVTLNWSLAGTAADSVSISPGVGSVTGLVSKSVNVAATTTFTLAASNAGGTRTRQVTVNVAADTTPPSVSLAANAATLIAPGSVKLTASASDNVGVTRVEFYRDGTLSGQATTAPYTLDLPLGAGDNGTLSLTAKAYDAAGNSAISAAVPLTVAIPLPDTTPPTVGLAATVQNVTAPGSTTLQAAATDNVGVARVDFYEGATLLGSSAVAPYGLGIAYTTGQVGAHTYTARAFDAAGNNATSAALTVNVALPLATDRYVDPAAGSDVNDGLGTATAFKTLTKAMASVPAGGTVWLASGSYAPENAGTPNPASLLAVPAGITVRALSDGGPQVGFGLSFANGGAAIGLVFNGPAVRSDQTGIDASGGSVALRNLRFANLGSATAGGGGFGARAAIRAHGSAVVTLDTDVASAVVFGGGVENAVLVFDSAKLTINGGRIEPSGACSTDACVGQMKAGGSAELSLSGMQLALNTGTANAPQPLLLLAGTSTVTVSGSALAQAGATTKYRDFAIVNETATFRLVDSTVGSTFHNVAGTQNGSPNIRFANVTLSGTVTNKAIGATFYSLGATPNVTLAGGSYSGFGGGGAVVDLDAGGNLLVVGATFSNNVRALRVAGATRTYGVVISQSVFNGNGTCARPGCFAISLEGDATSSFDLGSALAPGGNTLVSPAASTALLVKANATTTVSAVGNTWAASVQGADGAGHFNLGAAPCTAAACSVTGGNGQNYVVTTGALKLAGN